ncbi:MAG TPA: M14 metallopeptidase family protein [Blastocatellia bacterium]|nr:M14 metallopeptidase family protein [Blastocatellia bacterium]
MNRNRLLCVLLCLFAAIPNTFAAQRATAKIPAPRDVIGFMPGEDRKLVNWAGIVDYFKRLDRASDRLMLEELGKTTLGRPFLLATISSPANLARLDRFKEIQRKLADPRTFGDNPAEAEKLIAEGRTVVLITCGIHSTEVGANLVALNIAHRLASDDSPETREILDKCIVLLVPSLNPDGMDIVKNWYDKTLGTPAEGAGPPELYHHYVGHDNNRDWYAFTQVETQLTVDKVHNVWHPHIVHDIHQQGETGTRFFVPPYVEPWEPNVPPLIQAGVNFMGSAIAWEMIAQGKSGVVINGVYDAWTPARAYQHYHGGIRILSETASARLATPTNVPFEKQTPQVNVNPKERSWNYPRPWPGGDWRLADIVDYMQSGAFALLGNAARYRERWVRDFYRIGSDAVREKAGQPFAFLIPVPRGQGEDIYWRMEGLRRIEEILNRGGVEIIQAASEFEAGGARYPARTRIILMRQPYGAFAKTLLERQQYPDLREYPGGPPRRPYDVTAHTLPLLMGVNVTQVDQPFSPPRDVEDNRTRSSSAIPWHRGIITSPTPRVGVYKSYAASMDEGWTRWILDLHKVPYKSLPDAEVRAGNLRAKYDSIILPEQRPAAIVNGLPRNRYPEEFAGGIGAAGVEALKKFVEEGGTLITFNDASEFAIEHLGVPVKNVLQGVSDKEFYCPGSILKIRFDAADPLTVGVPSLESRPGEGIAWVERGPALEVTGDGARVVARFGDANELLLSGWLLGGEKIAGKGAIVEARRGKGRVMMFAFRPQYRGQSVATLPFLFNALLADAEK